MSTEENEKKENRPRKVARSASTADRPAFKPGEAPAEGAPPSGEAASKPERRWDVRAERPRGAARPERPARPQRGPRPERRPLGGDPEAPERRPGASGGRASPEMPRRGPVDRSSPDFVDRWLTQKARPRPEGPPFGQQDGKPGERGERRDRGERREGGRHERRGERAPVAHAKPVIPAAAPREAKKLPTLHETILVGLPKVAHRGSAHHLAGDAHGAKAEKAAQKPKTAREAIAAKAATAPKPVERAAPKSEMTLRPEWVSAKPADAARTLTEAGDAAEKLIEAWTQAPNASAIVEASHAETLPGSLRKSAKRALNILRARHVTIPEREASSSTAPVSSDEEVVEATFTPPDARGTISFTIARRQGGNRAHIAEVIVRDEMGVLEAVSTWMSRSQIKEAHQRVADSRGIPPVPVPPEWVRHRIAEARKLNATSGALLPLGLERCKDLVEPVPATAPKHPIAELDAEVRDDNVAGAAAELHVEPEFRAWLPDGQALDELLRKVGESMTAEESQDPAKIDSVLTEEVKNATDRYFTPELRAAIAGRMRDAALSVRQRAGDARAREVIQVARAIEQAGLITSPPHEIEFLKTFFTKGISFMAQRQGGQLRVPVRR